MNEQTEQDLREATSLLKDARAEIMSLRNVVKSQGDRLSVFDSMMALFNNGRRMGGSESGLDIPYSIDSFLAKLESRGVLKSPISNDMLKGNGETWPKDKLQPGCKQQ